MRPRRIEKQAIDNDIKQQLLIINSQVDCKRTFSRGLHGLIIMTVTERHSSKQMSIGCVINLQYDLTIQFPASGRYHRHIYKCSTYIQRYVFQTCYRNSLPVMKGYQFQEKNSNKGIYLMTLLPVLSEQFIHPTSAHQTMTQGVTEGISFNLFTQGESKDLLPPVWSTYVSTHTYEPLKCGQISMYGFQFTPDTASRIQFIFISPHILQVSGTIPHINFYP